MPSVAESRPPRAPEIDQRVYFHGISWPQFEAMLAIRGEHGGVRFTYLQGELELMSPSHYHEAAKKKLARLVEAFAEEQGIELEGYGSWTVKNELRERGVEPDDCCIVGPVSEGEPERPDFAIEVIHTSGGIDKLAVYRGLEVSEVWFFERGRLEFHRLEADGYVRATHSTFLPDLDAGLIVRCMEASSQTEAVRQLRAALRDR